MRALLVVLGLSTAVSAPGEPPTLAPQRFQQETATQIQLPAPISKGAVQLLDAGADGQIRVFASGRWLVLRENGAELLAGLAPASDQEFVVVDVAGAPVRVTVP